MPTRKHFSCIQNWIIFIIFFICFSGHDLAAASKKRRQDGACVPSPRGTQPVLQASHAPMSPCSQCTGGNNPALAGQQITGIRRVFSGSDLANAKKHRKGANEIERDMSPAPAKKICRAVLHRVMVNPGCLVIGRTRRRQAFVYNHNAQFLQNHTTQGTAAVSSFRM